MIIDSNVALKWFTSVVEHLNQGVCLADSEGVITVVNPEAARLLAVERDQLVGQPLAQSISMHIINDHFPTRFDEMVIDVQQSRMTRSGVDGLLLARDKMPIPIGYSLAPIIVQEELVGFVLTIHDMNPMRKLEKAERDMVAKSAMIEQLHKELNQMTTVAAPSRTAVMRPLHLSHGEQFQCWVKEYAITLDQAIEESTYRVSYNLSESLRNLADRMGIYGASPRDLIELHSQAIQSRRLVGSQRLKGYLAEGRLLILELMGHLVSYYRRLSHSPLDTVENPRA